MKAARCEGGCQFRTINPLPALNLCMLERAHSLVGWVRRFCLLTQILLDGDQCPLAVCARLNFCQKWAGGSSMTSDASDRLVHLRQFYHLLDRLEAKVGGRHSLASCTGRMKWPERGVYFFFEQGEERTETGSGPRVVRVGTHALTPRSRTTLWTRLSQHRGVSSTGGGNHRGSVFRKHVGKAILASTPGLECGTWGDGSSASSAIRQEERGLEERVSKVIRAMPIIWLPINDIAGPGSDRGYVERNSIALLSNFGKPPIDPPSAGWLGHHCNSEKVRSSGLWNSNHVEEDYAPDFLDRLAALITGAET